MTSSGYVCSVLYLSEENSPLNLGTGVRPGPGVARTGSPPRRMMLFGSRARGAAGPESDLDLMVEMETPLKPFERRMCVDWFFGLRDWARDLVVYTPGEVGRLTDVAGTLAHTIVQEGKVLYEAP
jgi:hypothetical protein